MFPSVTMPMVETMLVELKLQIFADFIVGFQDTVLLIDAGDTTEKLDALN